MFPAVMVGDKAGILMTVWGGNEAYHLANWGDKVYRRAEEEEDETADC